MILLILRDGKLENRVVVPDGWPNVPDPWKPPAGCTAEPAGDKEYPPVDPEVREKSLEEWKAFALAETFKYISLQPDAPQAVKDFMAKVKEKE